MSKLNRQRREEGRTELPERTGSPQNEDQPSQTTEWPQPLMPLKSSGEPRAFDYDPSGGNIPYTEPKKDLAKVMTDELTPLCPFCKSPKLSAITTPNPWGRKWVCGNCCSAFREPIRRKLA